MGYSNTAHHAQNRSWSDRCNDDRDVIDSTAAIVFDADNEKTMEESTMATAPTMITGGPSHAGDVQRDEDDTTTIQSIDSMTGRGILSMTEEDEDDDFHQDAVSRGLEAQSLLNTSMGLPEINSTCSVSTAPSTDEASSMGDWNAYPKQQQQYPQQHHRVPSWEVSPHNQYPATSHAGGNRGSPGNTFNLPPSYASSGWAPQQQHVASFRDSAAYHQQVGRHQHPQQGRYGADPSLPFLPANMGGRPGEGARTLYHRPSNQGQQYPYYMQQQQRKGYSQPPLPPSSTPPRGADGRSGGRGQIRLATPGQSAHRSQAGSGGPSSGGNRSSSEVLKTLLRKKACLYEPDTSRAVALVTWLVGRELAVQFGFFSRQQLQAGVHACMSHMIDSGTITRTKVNRCMQIILNSCFHYIIPRPDGTEENGEAFRMMFAKEMKDDSFLLSVLPEPWNTVKVDRAQISTAALVDHVKSPKVSPVETPEASPRLGSLTEKASPGKDSNDDGSESKRAVLLCFNENVRGAEDVFRCHNEFIRDTAHACHLQLSSNEWRLFFGREAARAPYLWGNIGIPVPFLEGQGPAQTDALGVMTKDEIAVFRTSWCCKRYDHDHELCGFAHAEINGGWMRRNPFLHKYRAEMCQFVTTQRAAWGDSNSIVVLNECPHGVDCLFAHSGEEIAYHPDRYKKHTCASLSRPGGCNLGDACPNFHPADSYRFPKKSDTRSPRHSRQSSQHQGPKGSTTSASAGPAQAPILYASPSPTSSFERHMSMPGLQELYRRNSAVMRGFVRSGRASASTYRCFDDDAGVDEKRAVKTERPKVVGSPKTSP